MTVDHGCIERCWARFDQYRRTGAYHMLQREMQSLSDRAQRLTHKMQNSHTDLKKGKRLVAEEACITTNTSLGTCNTHATGQKSGVGDQWRGPRGPPLLLRLRLAAQERATPTLAERGRP